MQMHQIASASILFVSERLSNASVNRKIQVNVGACRNYLVIY